jgi:hypothetical protein
MEKVIAPWGVELSLFRTTVGSEFNIVERLKRTGQASESIFFGAYGHFDLAAVRCLDDLSKPSLLPLDCDIIEASPFRFFADEANQRKQDFLRNLNTWDTAIAVFCKITPSLFLENPIQSRWRAAKLLREHFPEGYVFFGLGFSEAVVLVGGSDLPELLGRVTTLRVKTQSYNKPPQTESDLFFVKTATFPFVSHERIHAKRRYDSLKGDVFPVVTISCDPSAEGMIANLLPPGIEIRNSYGDTDLIVYWTNKEISFQQFSKSLTEIRKLASSYNSIHKTTSYLETPFPEQLKKHRLPTRILFNKKGPNRILEEAFKMIESLDPPSLRASVTDFCSRLFSCISDVHIETAYQDIANIFPYLMEIVSEITETENKISPARKNQARFELSLLCDLSRVAMNQRYAGLEIHPETLAHSQSPILSDIRSLISAASCTPQFIFNNLSPSAQKEEVWSGYILFGTTYSDRWCPADILALPGTAIYNPVGEWWRTTHEVAHAVFKLLDVEKRFDPKILAKVKNYFDGSMVSAVHCLHEIFANWFDWKYIFNRETSFFLESIWKSWIVLPVVWKKKHEYLVRAFTIFLAQDHVTLQNVINKKSNPAFDNFLEQRWKAFITVLKKNVPEFEKYLSEVTNKVKLEVWDEASVLSVAVVFLNKNFESVYRVQGLEKRLNPPYPALKRHLKALERGIVIEGKIPNPCRLQIELLRRSKNRPTSLATQGAFIFSLENSYLLSA